MISAKKIRTLKPRVQLRRAADVFHEAAAMDLDKEYLDEVLSIILSSDLVCDEDEDRIRWFYQKGDSLSFEDIYYQVLTILGDTPSDWDARDESGQIDWSKREVRDHFLFLDHLRSPYNVGAVFRNAEAFGIKGIYIAPGTASPEHPRAQRTSRFAVDGIPWDEREVAALPELPVFALEVGGMDINEFEFPRHGICIIGSEEDGISKEARKKAEDSLGIVSIKQYGAKGSINVASAAAIMLCKWIESESNQPLS